MNTTTISTKRQITLSKAELERLGIGIYGKLLKRVERGGIFLEPVTQSVVEQTAGSLSSHVPSDKKNKSFSYILKKTRLNVSRSLAAK